MTLLFVLLTMYHYLPLTDNHKNFQQQNSILSRWKFIYLKQLSTMTISLIINFYLRHELSIFYVRIFHRTQWVNTRPVTCYQIAHMWYWCCSHMLPNVYTTFRCINDYRISQCYCTLLQCSPIMTCSKKFDVFSLQHVWFENYIN